MLVGAQGGQPAAAPAADRGVVEGVQHAKIVLTRTDKSPSQALAALSVEPERARMPGGDWLPGATIG
ncbi:hypothetical protein KRMM14A1004_10610 [Krasilnikovia sp. MM14-A1004]